MLLACASFFELISASLVCGQSRYSCGSLNAYAVSVGAVSLALVAPVGLVLFAEPLAPRRLPEGLPHLSLMLLVWWLPAGFLLTFVGPFQGLSNGYFGTLAGVAGALLLARAYVPAFDQAVMTLTAMAREAPSERTALVALALTSTAMWVQAAISVGQVNEHVAVKAWAIIVGVVSFVICVFYLLLEHAPSHRVGFALLLAAWSDPAGPSLDPLTLIPRPNPDTQHHAAHSETPCRCVHACGERARARGPRRWSQGVALSFVPSHFVMTLNGFASTWYASLTLTLTLTKFL